MAASPQAPVTSRRLKVTYLSPFVPYARIPHAGGQFLHHYLESLSESVDISLVAPASDPNQAASTRPDVTRVHLHLVPIRPRPRTWIGFLPRLMANTITGVTPGFQVLAGFRRDPHVWSLVAQSDVVELGWAWYLAFLPDLRRVDTSVPITAFEHDVLTESLFRRARDGYVHERTLGRIQAMRARSREPKLLNRCNAVFTFSDRDRQVLQDLGVTSQVVVVDPFIELRPAADLTHQPPTVLFVGAMDRPENHQGARWLIEQVWPAVEEACPDARLVIAGTSPPQALIDLAGGRVEVTGYVADLQPLYLGTSVFVAPNRTGAGVKFKVLDAMSYGLPVVATPVAAEGIVERCGLEVFGGITGEAREMASLVIGLLQEPTRAKALGEKARARVRERYDFARTVNTVLETYRELTGE